MIVRASFPAAHAWILAQTFEAHGAGLPGASPAPAHAEVPLHEGVRIARDGDPMPPPPAGTLDDSHDGTDHD